VRDYGELLRTGVELAGYDGYLDTEGLKERNKVQARYNTLRNAIVYDLLRREPDAAAAHNTMHRELDAERPGTPEGLLAFVDQVETELAAQIERDGARAPWRRTLVHRGPWIVAAVVLAIYFGLRIYSRQPVDAPLQTRAGIVQRAAAAHKALRYADWTDTRRRRWVAELLFWPIAPTDAETKGAGEFAAMVLDGRRFLAEQRLICAPAAPSSAEGITDADLDLVGTVADAVRAPGLRWADPPILTLLAPIRAAYPCR